MKKYVVQLGNNMLMGSTLPVTDKGKSIPHDSHLFRRMSSKLQVTVQWKGAMCELCACASTHTQSLKSPYGMPKHLPIITYT